jgi:hypothetical protein
VDLLPLKPLQVLLSALSNKKGCNESRDAAASRIKKYSGCRPVSDGAKPSFGDGALLRAGPLTGKSLDPGLNFPVSSQLLYPIPPCNSMFRLTASILLVLLLPPAALLQSQHQSSAIQSFSQEKFEKLLMSSHAPEPGIRGAAYRELALSLPEIPFSSQQLRVVYALIEGCRDSSVQLALANLLRLREIPPALFDARARYEISSLFRSTKLPADKLVLLCGYIGCREPVEALRGIIGRQPAKNPGLEGAVHLALARMGDKEELDFLLARLRKLPVDNLLVYEVLPGLLYVRQKEIFDYLFEIILSESPDCSSPNPSSDRRMPCAYRCMELVAPFVIDFPLSSGADGNLRCADYDQALRQVREWIKSHKDSYQIRQDVF